MSKATPHHHGHGADLHADGGPREEHGKASTEHGSRDQHAGHSPEMFRDKFWLSLGLTVLVVFWSAHIQELLGYRAPAFPGSSDGD